MIWPDDYKRELEDFLYYEERSGLLFCADYREIIGVLPNVDIVLTDPPYDEQTHRGGKFDKQIAFGNASFASMDIIPIVDILLPKCHRWLILFTSVERLGLIRTDFPEQYIRGGIWDRVQNSPQISGDRPAQAVEGIAILPIAVRNNGMAVARRLYGVRL